MSKLHGCELKYCHYYFDFVFKLVNIWTQYYSWCSVLTNYIQVAGHQLIKQASQGIRTELNYVHTDNSSDCFILMNQIQIRYFVSVLLYQHKTFWRRLDTQQHPLKTKGWQKVQVLDSSTNSSTLCSMSSRAKMKHLVYFQAENIHHILTTESTQPH